MSDNIEYNEDNRPRSFEPHPKGPCKAVCVDVIDLGMVPNTYKTNEDGSPKIDRKVRIVWETDKLRKDGKRFHTSKSYNLKLSDGSGGYKPSTLFSDLRSWLGASWNGKTFSAKLIEGRPAMLYISHFPNANDPTKVFARIVSVDPDDSDNPLVPSGEYKRWTPKPEPTDEEAVPF